MSPLPRQGAIVVVESAVWTLAGVGVSVLLFRWFDGGLDSHWGISLMVLIWLISMANQLYRTKVAGLMRRVRFALAGVFALPVVLGLAADGHRVQSAFADARNGAGAADI